jgi:hypothetical protein
MVEQKPDLVSGEAIEILWHMINGSVFQHLRQEVLAHVDRIDLPFLIKERVKFIVLDQEFMDKLYPVFEIKTSVDHFIGSKKQ